MKKYTNWYNTSGSTVVMTYIYAEDIGKAPSLSDAIVTAQHALKEVSNIQEYNVTTICDWHIHQFSSIVTIVVAHLLSIRRSFGHD